MVQPWSLDLAPMPQELLGSETSGTTRRSITEYGSATGCTDENTAE